jgi:hypothetical protein
MTREDQLCLLPARGQLIPEVRSQILELLSTSLQWPLVLERAYSHVVYPLLYRSLRALGYPGVPQVVQTELKSAYLANTWRNELFAEELARLLGLLGQAGGQSKRDVTVQGNTVNVIGMRSYFGGGCI